MAMIRECDLPRMHHYQSYDLAWLTPIVFPLSMAIVVQGGAWVALFRERSSMQSAATILAAGELLVETFFGIFCFASCVANFGGRDYAGGQSHCAFQAWYAGWYIFSQLPMLATISAASFLTFRDEGALPSTGASAAAVLGSLGVGALVAALPFFGIGQYVFAKDYCTVDMQDPAFAVLLIIFVLVTAGLMLLGHGRALLKPSTLPKQKTISAAAVLLFLWGWTVAAVISLHGLAGGGFCGDPFETKSPAYGLNAVFLHVQQLANPILYVMYWRRQFPAFSYASADVQPGTGTVVVTGKKQVELGDQDQSVAGA
mmetsp:Transcript_61834/g.109815  ORF Transcript_61834/g.109815 Transcript_61834/m.109815 type:complete len:314 (+) Transcript_61834:30-971(+)